MTYPPLTVGAGRSGQPSAKLLRGVIIWRHSTNAPPLCSHAMLCIPSSPHLAHYMEIFSSCVFLSPTMQSATWFLNTRRFWSIWTLQSYCWLSMTGRSHPPPALTSPRYLCLASHLTVLHSISSVKWDTHSSHLTGLWREWNEITCVKCLAYCLSPI